MAVIIVPRWRKNTTVVKKDALLEWSWKLMNSEDWRTEQLNDPIALILHAKKKGERPARTEI